MYRNCKSGTTGLASELDQLGTWVTVRDNEVTANKGSWSVILN